MRVMCLVIQVPICWLMSYFLIPIVIPTLMLQGDIASTFTMSFDRRKKVNTVSAFSHFLRI